MPGEAVSTYDQEADRFILPLPVPKSRCFRRRFRLSSRDDSTQNLIIKKVSQKKFEMDYVVTKRKVMMDPIPDDNHK